MTGRRYKVDDIVSVEATIEDVIQPFNGDSHVPEVTYRIRSGAAIPSVFWMTQTDMDRYAEPVFVTDDDPKPGDSVHRTWEAGETDASIGRVVAVDEDLAWVRFGGFSAVYPFCDLQVVKERT